MDNLGSFLTAEIARATFGITPGEHSQLKGLEAVKTGNNLRDHMTDLELIFTMLGEASTTEIARRSDAQGFIENKTSAKQGGRIAGDARKALERKTGRKVVSKSNFLAVSKRPDLLEAGDAEGAASPTSEPKMRTAAKRSPRSAK
jgi:DNA-damage-inducible protein D